MQTIAIIGGGFAGLNLISKIDHNKYQVKLIDRNNFHTFPPLFYQIASSGLATGDICFPFRREFRRHRNTTYHMGHVKAIDTTSKTITTSYETIPYDLLVIAAGTTNNFFGMDKLSQNVFCIKTAAQAAHTRDEILDRLERGAICKDPLQRRRLLSFLIVGGGPAGVEIAGSIGEMKKYIIPREYPELNPDDVKITLVEGTDRLLAAMGSKASAKALQYLESLMVDVRLNTIMKDYADKIVTFADGQNQYCETIIWTAGVAGEPIPGLPAQCITHGGRIKVDRYNRVEGFSDVFAIGDICIHIDPENPRGMPQVAQVAIQQARNLAKNLNHGLFSSPFRYKDKGSMATVGRNRAVCSIGNTFISGRPAWWLWLAVHLISLLGMRNKINVILNWTWNYLFYNTSLRLLLRPTRYPLRRHWGD